jgi:hypothetical protein
MIAISVKTNVKDITKRLNFIARKQVPFATAQALTAMAKQVQAAEAANLVQKLKSPSPFTRNAVGMTAARKTNLQSQVFIKDKTAKYLNPFEAGGEHVLPGRALLNPKNVKLNAYGQLPRKLLARLKARPDVFIGEVRFKDGRVINGVWQRPPTGERQRGRNGSKGNTWNKVDGKRTGGLKLLIRFGDALPVKTRLEYHALARSIVDRDFKKVFAEQLLKALASAK